MIILDREVVFINWYLQEKEYYYTDHVRNALNQINYFEVKKKNSRALAIHIVSEIYKKDYNINFSKEFLWEVYRSRRAHIKNAKDEFKRYEMKKKLESSPNYKIKLCACGCGLPVKSGNKYIHGHHRRCLSQEEKNENARRMREAKELKNSENNIIQFSNFK